MMFARNLALTGLLALPMSVIAHPGTSHQHSASEIWIVIGMVLLVAVFVGVISQRKSLFSVPKKNNAKQIRQEP